MRGIEQVERLTVEVPWDLYRRIREEQRRREDAGRSRSDRAIRAIVIDWLRVGADCADGEGSK